MAERKSLAFQRKRRERRPSRQIQAVQERPGPWESFGPSAAAMGLQSLLGLGSTKFRDYLKEQREQAAWARGESEKPGTPQWYKRQEEEFQPEYDADMAAAEADAEHQNLQYRAAQEKAQQVMAPQFQSPGFGPERYGPEGFGIQPPSPPSQDVPARGLMGAAAEPTPPLRVRTEQTPGPPDAAMSPSAQRALGKQMRRPGEPSEIGGAKLPWAGESPSFPSRSIGAIRGEKQEYLAPEMGEFLDPFVSEQDQKKARRDSLLAPTSVQTREPLRKSTEKAPAEPAEVEFEPKEVVHRGKQNIAEYEKLHAATQRSALAKAGADTIKAQEAIDYREKPEAQVLAKELRVTLSDENLIGGGTRKGRKATALRIKKLREPGSLRLIRGRLDTYRQAVPSTDPGYIDLAKRLLYLERGAKGTFSEFNSRLEGGKDDIYAMDGTRLFGSQKDIDRVRKANDAGWRDTVDNDAANIETRQTAFQNQQRHRNTVNFNKTNFADPKQAKADFLAGKAVTGKRGIVYQKSDFVLTPGLTAGRGGEIDEAVEARAARTETRAIEKREEDHAKFMERTNPDAKDPPSISDTRAEIRGLNTMIASEKANIDIMKEGRIPARGDRKVAQERSLDRIQAYGEDIDKLNEYIKTLQSKPVKEQIKGGGAGKRQPTASEVEQFRGMSRVQQNEVIRRAEGQGVDTFQFKQALPVAPTQ